MAERGEQTAAHSTGRRHAREENEQLDKKSFFGLELPQRSRERPHKAKVEEHSAARKTRGRQ